MLNTGFVEGNSVMTIEQFIDFLFGASYWFVLGGFIVVALYAVFSRLRAEE